MTGPPQTKAVDITFTHIPFPSSRPTKSSPRLDPRTRQPTPSHIKDLTRCQSCTLHLTHTTSRKTPIYPSISLHAAPAPLPTFLCFTLPPTSSSPLATPHRTHAVPALPHGHDTWYYILHPTFRDPATFQVPENTGQPCGSVRCAGTSS